MSHKKAILRGKERRKPYRGAKAIDRSCRNHGRCDWCRGGRLHKRRVTESAAMEQLKEFCHGKTVCSRSKFC